MQLVNPLLRVSLLVFLFWQQIAFSQSENESIQNLRNSIYAQPAKSYELADSLLNHAELAPQQQVELWNLK